MAPISKDKYDKIYAQTRFVFPFEIDIWLNLRAIEHSEGALVSTLKLGSRHLLTSLTLGDDVFEQNSAILLFRRKLFRDHRPMTLHKKRLTAIREPFLEIIEHPVLSQQTHLPSLSKATRSQ